MTSPLALADIDFHLAFGIGIAHSIIKSTRKSCRSLAGSPRTISCSIGVGVSDVDRLRVGDHLGVAAHFLEQIAKVDRLQVEARGAGALAGDEQEIVDQHR